MSERVGCARTAAVRKLFTILVHMLKNNEEYHHQVVTLHSQNAILAMGNPCKLIIEIPRCPSTADPQPGLNTVIRGNQCPAWEALSQRNRKGRLVRSFGRLDRGGCRICPRKQPHLEIKSVEIRMIHRIRLITHCVIAVKTSLPSLTTSIIRREKLFPLVPELRP